MVFDGLEHRIMRIPLQHAGRRLPFDGTCCCFGHDFAGFLSRSQHQLSQIFPCPSLPHQLGHLLFQVFDVPSDSLEIFEEELPGCPVRLNVR